MFKDDLMQIEAFEEHKNTATEFVQTSPPGAPKPAAKGKNVAAIVAAAADGSFDKDPLTPEARKQL